MHAVIKLRPLLLHLPLPFFAVELAVWMAGGTGSLYSGLVLPRFLLPQNGFLAAQSIVFLLVGGAGCLCSSARGTSSEERRGALLLYGVVTLMYCMWQLICFRFRMLTLGGWWMILLFLTAGLCAALFFRIRPESGALLTPLLFWLVYAGTATFSLSLLN